MLKPSETSQVNEILEDWQYWVFAGSYRLEALGLTDE